MIKEDYENYNVYIDESGDEGVKRGLKYFILTAVIVKASRDLLVSKSIDKIKEELELNIKSQLHWKLLKGKPNKKMVIQKIAEQKITIISIVIDTDKIQHIQSKDMYNYFSGYLYERVSDFMIFKHGKANIKISSRGNLTKQQLYNYLINHKQDYSIDFNRVDLKNIKIYPNSQKKLLQMADCCCSALGQTLRYNDDTSCEIYKPLLKKHFSSFGNIYNKGFKIVPPHSIPFKYKLLKDFGYKDKKKTIKN